ncbi:MAG: hypothetical protein N2578_03805 [Bdellovibrionaceae bacterium]|nr:hypothetical protein [Pseudobdellovibrionaceae bacterium]
MDSMMLRFTFAFLFLLFSACEKPLSRLTPDAGGEAVRLLNESFVLRGLKSFEPLDGSYARISVNAEEAPYRLKLLKTSRGEKIPGDILTTQVLWIYRTWQELHDLDLSFGLNEVMPWPRRILLLQSSTRNSSRHHDNALFHPAGDLTVIFTYRGEALPLALNRGILAHEHFHALFWWAAGQKLAASGLLRLGSLGDLKAKEELYNQLYLNSLNEGLADWWGWLFTGEENFVGATFPLHRDSRTLKPVPDFVFSLDRQTLENEVSLVGNATNLITQRSYQFGRDWSLLLKELSLRMGRKRVVAALFSSLGALGNSAPMSVLMEPQGLAAQIVQNMNVSSGECESLKVMLPRLDCGGGR